MDVATGREWWRYDPSVSDDAIPDAEPGRPCAARILQRPLDGRRIAFDAAIGRLCADFDVDGQVNLLEGIAPGFYAVTSSPIIVRAVAR